MMSKKESELLQVSFNESARLKKLNDRLLTCCIAFACLVVFLIWGLNSNNKIFDKEYDKNNNLIEKINSLQNQLAETQYDLNLAYSQINNSGQPYICKGDYGDDSHTNLKVRCEKNPNYNGQDIFPSYTYKAYFGG